MANVLIEESSLEDIADAIREKNGSSDTYRAADMAGAISNLSSGVSDVQIDGTSIVSSGVANIPYASTTAAGVVNTETQIFTGQKVFNPYISIDNRDHNNNYPTIYFRDSKNEYHSDWGFGANSAIIANVNTDITQNRLGLVLLSPKSDGTGYTSKSENYMLPTATIGLTASQTYNIITTKPTYEFTGTWSSSYTSCPCFSEMTVGSQVEIEWKQYGKLVCANFKVSRAADTTAGSNVYGANIRADYLPAVTVCSAGYYSSSGVIAKYDTNGTFTCRVIGATLATNNVVQIGMTFMLT